MWSSVIRRMSSSSPFEFALILITLLILAAFSQINKQGVSTEAMAENNEQPEQNQDNSGYKFNQKDLSRGKQFFLEKDGEPVSYARVLELLRDGDETLTAAFVGVLKNSVSDYSAYFFETPGTTLKAAKDHQFEFVLNDASRSLGDVEADKETFSKHFRGPSAKNNVATFSSLGKDAKLIAPCPVAAKPSKTFAHLAEFMRGGDQDQVTELWKITAKEMLERLSRHPDRTTWLSTSGLGVYWLHVRLDSYPKYYTYKPYKDRKG